ncbi:MAG TPA: riboflavin synthase [Longimicrobiaceae bacterium]|nr:riboflavin synthase [Longimicrobiaceae bacterium]
MFTGIIEEVGVIASVEAAGNGVVITVQADAVLDELEDGDSVSIDGVCQTVTSRGDGSFTVQAVATTLGRTTLGEYRTGRRVNLERALRLGARLGGHVVQGHVDGVGRVLSIRPQSELVLIDFTLPPEVEPVTVLHGSIALNGVSLTVNAIPERGVAEVSIIPFTWEHTALADLCAGEGVNLEGDMIGKYVRHLLSAPGGEDLRRGWGY